MQQVKGGVALPLGGGKFELIVDCPANRKVINYWGNLIDNELLLITPAWSDDWIKAVKEGMIASFPWAAAWVPGFVLKGVFPELAGKWRLADALQWKDSPRFVSFNFGGSCLAVVKGAKDVKAAALFAQWITQAPEAVELSWKYPGIWPSNVKRLKELAVFREPWDYFGGQVIGDLYIKAQENIFPENVLAVYGQPFWQIYVTQFPEILSGAAQGKYPWDEVLPRLLDAMIPQIEDAGFEVTEKNGKIIASYV